MPDLTISGLSVGHTVQGGEATVRYVLNNSGNAVISEEVCTSIRILRGNSLIFHRNYCIKKQSFKSGESYPYEVIISTPYSPGNYTLHAKADNMSNIVELDENNNVQIIPMTIDAPPIGELVSTMRFYNTRFCSHLYSVHAGDIVGLPQRWPEWQYAGSSFKAFTDQRSGTVPIYACWSKYNTHKYSRSWSSAKQDCVENPWIAFYDYPSPAPDRKPIRQLWHPQLQVYIYSNGEADANFLVNNYGFQKHGIVWYAPK